MTEQEKMERAMRELSKALEVGLYYGEEHERYKLRNLLSKLGIKSAKGGSFVGLGAALTIESLEEAFKAVAACGGKP